MRKINSLVWFSFGLLMFGILVFAGGCGQIGTEAKVTIGQGSPQGLEIRGRVLINRYNYVSSSPSLIETQTPIEGAYISLSGSSTEVIKTDANGDYNFKNVPAGSYTVIVTKEGFQKGTASGNFSTENLPDNSVLTLNVNLIDNPQILSVKMVSPEVIVTFSEPMYTSSVLAYLSYNGLRSYSVSAMGAIEVEKSWDTDNKVLKIKPTGGIVSAANYSLTIVGPDYTFNGIKDKDGNSIDPTGYLSSGGTSININLTSESDPNNTSKPITPTNLKVLTLNNSTEVDFLDIYNASNNIYLSWDSVNQASNYKVYCSTNNGPFQLYNSVTTNSIAVNAENVDAALSDFQRTGSSTPQDQGNGIVWPFIGNYPIDIKVTAVNANGESDASNIKTIKDTVKPRATSALRTYLAWGNYSTTEVTVGFSELLDKTSTTSSDYYLIAGQTINKAEYNNSSASVKLTFSPGTSFGTVEVKSNVKDLTGNEIDPNNNKRTFN